MTSVHAAGVPAVHQAGIDEGDATFGTAAPGWAAFDAAELPGYRFVALGADGSVLGWTAVSPVSARTGDAGAVEHPVSVRPDARGRGAASGLLATLIRSTEAAGIWTLQAGIGRDLPGERRQPGPPPARRVPRVVLLERRSRVIT
ncbi:GNAT family N-acetyltransferase [Streptomyces sp. 7-21]|nr:GNAT family N-acetyltransferase [Streptomyces sp. 7-21]